MATKTDYAHGEFCWLDVATTDPAAAKRFYGSLFGWTFEDMSGAAGSIYSMAGLRKQSVAGLYQLDQQRQSRGVPPHWFLYINVRNADDTAKTVATQGGKVIEGPFDIMDAGRTAPIQDPTGAYVGIWQKKQYAGAQVMAEPGALCWQELMTPDTAAGGKFYGATFGWTANAMDMGGGMTYTVFKAGDTMVGGMMARPAQLANVPPNWIPYFAVANCDASAAQVGTLGGTVTRPPTDIPDVGRFAVCRDGQGAAFAMLQPK